MVSSLLYYLYFVFTSDFVFPLYICVLNVLPDYLPQWRRVVSEPCLRAAICENIGEDIGVEDGDAGVVEAWTV